MTKDTIVVLDFGSQYAHLIAKRLRLLGFYSEIALPSVPVSELEGARGIVLSGGPSSVYEKDIPRFNSDILLLDIPILGLCYGHHLMAMENGGTVARGDVGEFGIAHLLTTAEDGTAFPESPLFNGITFPAQVWMSHQDTITALPDGFRVIGRTVDCPYAAIENTEKKRWSLQCHIEVKDTVQGDAILANFAKICGMEKNWSQDQVLELVMEDIRAQANRGGRERKVLLFLSGGVDSTVAFALLNTALGQERVLGLHIDNGFMRKNESAIISKRYHDAGFTNFIVEDASDTFLAAIAGKTDPQKKRMAVGETFITVRDTVVARLGLNEDDWLLGQGTLYPDIIESGGSQNAHVIKTHHNRVDGIQALIEKGLIIEPLRDLYKDEVRIMGKKLGLDDELVYRHPFPGPGLSINVLCHDGSPADESALARSREELSRITLTGAFPACENAASGHPPTLIGTDALPVKSVGVQGDYRTYRFPAVLRFADIFSAFPAWDDLEAASSRITNSSKEINRTILSLWERPGTNFSLSEGYCTRDRLDQTREVDAIVLEELKNAGWYTRIFQHLTIHLPWAAEPGHASIVLRPVVSEDVMTARFAHLDIAVLERIVTRIKATGFVDALYYDITNKPPATFGWE